MLEHERCDVLAMDALSFYGGPAGADQVAHCLVALVRHPHRGEFVCTQQSGQSDRVATVGLHLITRPPWDERGSDNGAIEPHRPDQAMKSISRRSSFIAKSDFPVLRCEPLHQAAHARLVSIEFAQIPHLAGAPIFGDRDRVPQFRHVDADKRFSKLSHNMPSAIAKARHSRRPRHHRVSVGLPSVAQRTYGLTYIVREIFAHLCQRQNAPLTA